MKKRPHNSKPLFMKEINGELSIFNKPSQGPLKYLEILDILLELDILVKIKKHFLCLFFQYLVFNISVLFFISTEGRLLLDFSLKRARNSRAEKSFWIWSILAAIAPFIPFCSLRNAWKKRGLAALSRFAHSVQALQLR